MYSLYSFIFFLYIFINFFIRSKIPEETVSYWLSLIHSFEEKDAGHIELQQHWECKSEREIVPQKKSHRSQENERKMMFVSKKIANTY